jgi:hypothetical protein
MHVSVRMCAGWLMLIDCAHRLCTSCVQIKLYEYLSTSSATATSHVYVLLTHISRLFSHTEVWMRNVLLWEHSNRWNKRLVWFTNKQTTNKWAVEQRVDIVAVHVTSRGRYVSTVYMHNKSVHSHNTHNSTQFRRNSYKCVLYYKAKPPADGRAGRNMLLMLLWLLLMHWCNGITKRCFTLACH